MKATQQHHAIRQDIWDDVKFQSLGSHARFLFLALLTHPERTAIGTLRAQAGALADFLKTSIDDAAAALTELCEAGMAQYDGHKRLVFLYNFVKHHPPKSAQAVKEWVKIVNALPECSLKDGIIARCREALAGCPERFGEIFAALGGKSAVSQILPAAGQAENQARDDAGAENPAAASPAPEDASAEGQGKEERKEEEADEQISSAMAQALDTIWTEWPNTNRYLIPVAKDRGAMEANALLIAKRFPDLTPERFADAVRRYLKSAPEQLVGPQEFFKPVSNGVQPLPLWVGFLGKTAVAEARESA